MKLKHTFIALVTLLLVGTSAFSQTVVTCENYSEAGKAEGIYSSWDISPSGSYIYILYNQPTNMKSGLWYVYIDILDATTNAYRPVETISITPETNKNWYVQDQKFTQAGKYKASFMFNGTSMATTEFDVDVDQTLGSTGDTTITTFYYEDSYVKFCTSVDAVGNLTGEAETFYLGSNAGITVKAYCSNNLLPFKTNLIYVDVYREGEEKMIDSFNISVEKDWDYVHFNVDFSSPGTYYIDLYNADDIFINTGTVEIAR